jgi:c-di-GMP-binding flagellar brake protein YcgR
MSMETQPMPLEALSEANGGLDDFRITAPSEILAYLKQLCSSNVSLSLVGPEGPSVSTTVWAVDSERGMVSFSAESNNPDLERILLARDALVVGYLDNVKLQFDVSDMTLARGGKPSAMNARIPKEMFRFQRRDAYRVKPLPRSAPYAHMRHPDAIESPIELRVIDLSIGGCALLVPAGLPSIEPGMVLEGVHIDLDGNASMRCNLLVHHLSTIDEDLGEAPGSVRIGCEMIGIGPDSARQLQRFIDQTQQRRRHVLSL